MSSNPLYHPTDIRPLQLKPISSLPPGSGLLDVNAIYAEPLPPPSTHEPEWDPDQNIYESIYSEPINPSLFMRNSEPTDMEELRPYSSIYTVPVVPTTIKPRSVSLGNIKEIKHLGDGNFGQVVLAQTVGLTPKDLQLDGDASYTLVAVKKLKPSASNRNRELFDKEVSFMSRLNHPNVIRLLGVCSEGEIPFIMMEYMTNGDLNQYLQGFYSIADEPADSAKSISTSTLMYMCTQISSAMQYLASQNFVHRDLATRNCLVGSKDTIKISDFGMSRSLYESQYYVINGHAILPIRWMATECFFGKFSAKTDVWAFGVAMWEIFTLAKETPYNHLEDRAVVEDAVRGAKRTLLNRPAQCPENMYEIMRKCWIHDASQRPTFDELYNLLSKN
jgi:serine/threonine protein kinase